MLNVMEAVRRSLATTRRRRRSPGGYAYHGWAVRTYRNAEGHWSYRARQHRRKKSLSSGYAFPTRGDALAAARIRIDKRIRQGD